MVLKIEEQFTDVYQGNNSIIAWTNGDHAKHFSKRKYVNTRQLYNGNDKIKPDASG